MSRSDEDEPQFRLRPRKPPTAKNSPGPVQWANAFRTLMHYARNSRTGTGRGGTGARRHFYQQCAVRVTYAPNRMGGHWRAHGRYLSRQNATASVNQPGFGAEEQSVDLTGTLERWQQAGDPRLFKLILSPEFGERMELEKLTRDVMRRMSLDLGSPLQWVAVVHRNTDHPHIHVALRGIEANGAELRLPRKYVKSGLRASRRSGRRLSWGTGPNGTRWNRSEGKCPCSD
jgi:hypothetical protein